MHRLRRLRGGLPERGGTPLYIRKGDPPLPAASRTAGTGAADAPVYATELTGEAVLVTATLGVGQQLCARGDRHLRCEIGSVVGLEIDPVRTYLFDAATEQRIRA